MLLIPRQLQEKKPLGPGQKGSWRRQAALFQQPEGVAPPLGVPVFSPALFPTGRSVRDQPVLCQSSLTVFQPLSGHSPVVSSSLTRENRESGAAFLEKVYAPNAIISAILAIIHPQQFRYGMALNDQLADQEPFKEVMAKWSSCFTGMQVINNRIIGPHRDTGGPYSSLDVIAAVGEFKGGHIHLTNSPYDFRQSPGSILALASRVFEHEVMPYEGNRISFAWFVKDALYQWAHIPEIPWAQEADILDRL